MIFLGSTILSSLSHPKNLLSFYVAASQKLHLDLLVFCLQKCSDTLDQCRLGQSSRPGISHCPVQRGSQQTDLDKIVKVTDLE